MSLNENLETLGTHYKRTLALMTKPIAKNDSIGQNTGRESDCLLHAIFKLQDRSDRWRTTNMSRCILVYIPRCWLSFVKRY